jgi:hypothetical protein
MTDGVEFLWDKVDLEVTDTDWREVLLEILRELEVAFL